jgi:hypothetical protein
MFEAYLTIEIQAYIAEKSTEPIEKVAFQKNPFPALDKVFLMQQIVGKQKAQQKLPTWFETANILFPPKVSIEQTSSEITAEYKASLIENGSLCDLSGGFGVDSFYFSKRCKQVVHCEPLKTFNFNGFVEVQGLDTESFTNKCQAYLLKFQEEGIYKELFVN